MYRSRIGLLVVLAIVVGACGDSSQSTTTQAPTTTSTSDSGVTSSSTPSLEGPFRWGYILPATGPSAGLGPAMTAAVELAVGEINDAGGIFGAELTLTGGDEAGDPTLASQAMDRLVSEGIDVLMGPGSTGIALALMDKLARSQILACSGATTGPQLTVAEDDGFYFRTIYSNALQGRAVGQLVTNDGHKSVGIIGRLDAFGEPLMEAIQDVLGDADVEVVAAETYPPDTATFDAEVRAVLAGNPDAIVIVGLDERVQIIQALERLGSGPTAMPTYTAGVLPADAWERVDPSNPGVLEGVQGTNPPTLSDPGFLERLQEINPDLTNNLYAVTQYDCAIITALAATAARSIDPEVFKTQMSAVTTGDEECNSYTDCVALLSAGSTIAYVGPSGALRLNDAGDTTIGYFDLYRINAEGEAELTEQITIEAAS